MTTTNPYQPKTGQPCSCKPGMQRDNCPQCEGTGQRIDFAAIRNRTTHPTTHTPGPWTVHDDGQVMLEDQINMLKQGLGADDEWVSVGEYDDEGALSVTALCHPNNATLIANAPALLEALETLVRRIERDNLHTTHGVQLQPARLAIAQATGR